MMRIRLSALPAPTYNSKEEEKKSDALIEKESMNRVHGQ